MHVREMIRSRRETQEQAMDRHDLFSQLINARDASEVLSEDELIGEQ